MRRTKEKSTRLHIGCGKDIRQGWINLDSLKLPGIDIVHDLNIFPYPFKENTYTHVYASHVLEHVDDLIAVLTELKRICKPGAHICIRMPHFSCGVSYRDPTHKRLCSYFTFDYFTDDCFYGLPQFKIVKRRLNYTRLAHTFLNRFMNPLINVSPALYERLFCWMIPCAECICILEVRK